MNAIIQNLQIKTGDVYLGQGSYKISQLTKLVTNSQITHSGLLFKLGEEILTWESYKPILHEPANYFTGKFGKGTQSVLFQDRLTTYTGNILLLRLKSEFDNYRPILERLILTGKYNRGFCSSWFKLAAAGFKWPINFNAGKTFFCSELVLTLYRESGIVEASVEPWRYTPVDLLRSFGFLFEAPLVLKG